MGITSKSHANAELIEGRRQGKQLWTLDTGGAGEDDILIGTRAEVEADICDYLGRDDLPKGWTLTQFTDEIED